MLEKCAVLIVEDEPLVGLDLCDMVEREGGSVLGPAASIQEALEILANCTPDAAILDIRLSDGEVTPVVLELAKGHIPFVVHTGSPLPRAMAEDGNRPMVLTKPLAARTVVAGLEAELRRYANM
jgi:DNA-binding response OmpR family regulator